MKFVIAISRQLGSGGQIVGRCVAERLGMRFIDREILRQVSEALGRDELELESRDERLSTFWDDLLQSLAHGAPTAGWIAPPLQLYLSDRDLFDAEKDVMRRLCAEADCVVMGRGAFHVLHGHARILSILTHAPLEARVQRLAQVYPDMSLAEAREDILRSDRQRKRFIERMTGRDWLCATNYDLCINTGRIALDGAADLVVEAAARVAR